MENLFKVIILAIIQGVTEFLPVSSSGHLVLSKHFLGLEATHGATLEIVLHSGTLVSILVFYGKHILHLVKGVFRGEKSAVRFVLLVLLGCIPAIILGFTAKAQLEEAFSNPRFVSCMLIATGLFLISSHFAKPGKKQVGWVSGLVIGLSQAVAMLPGISRSGSTIGTARFLGIEPKEAAVVHAAHHMHSVHHLLCAHYAVPRPALLWVALPAARVHSPPVRLKRTAHLVGSRSAAQCGSDGLSCVQPSDVAELAHLVEVGRSEAEDQLCVVGGTMHPRPAGLVI